MRFNREYLESQLQTTSVKTPHQIVVDLMLAFKIFAINTIRPRSAIIKLEWQDKSKIQDPFDHLETSNHSQRSSSSLSSQISWSTI